MKQLSAIQTLVLMILLLIFIGACGKSTTLTKSERDKLVPEVSEAVDRFIATFAAADTAAMDKIIVKEYWHNNTNGTRPTRMQWLNWLGGRKGKLESGELIIDKFYNENLEIEILSRNVAIVNGINVSIGTNSGEPFQNAVRFSHVWIKEDGRWKRRMFHDSRMQNYFSN